VRPEQVQVEAGDAGFPATVVDAYFLGGSTTLALQVPGLPAPLLATVHGTSPITRGERVGLRFTGATAVALDEAEPSGIPSTPRSARSIL
jgi:spermidine/putrescine transport system ATP-binding protein/putrescine transport system ATP-binding protein